MRKSIYSVVVFSILLGANLIGCNREDITELMLIRDIEIYATAIDLPYALDVFAISVLVTGSLSSDNCIENYEIDYDVMPNVFDMSPIYFDGTISIEIKGTVMGGNVECRPASPYYIDTIFLGYCKPGEYTIDVNGYTETFRVE